MIFKRSNKNQKRTLEEWYKQTLSSLIEKKLIFFEKKIGVKYKSFNIRSYKKRLGSCSNSHDLSFNWKIVMFPEKIIDYIIVHELCHIVYFNHSKLFWNKVAIYCPDFKAHKEWIKNNSEILIW